MINPISSTEAADIADAAVDYIITFSMMLFLFLSIFTYFV